MGTVPTPARPLSGTVLAQVAHTDTWWNAQNFLLQPPSCRVHFTTSTPFALGTNPIVWNVEDWDIFMAGDTEQHSTSTNPERITIRTAGRYRVSAMVALAASTAQLINVQLYKNTTAAGASMWIGTAVGGSYTQALTDEVQCAAGDYLTIQVTTTATGITVRGDVDAHMAVTWISN